MQPLVYQIDSPFCSDDTADGRRHAPPGSRAGDFNCRLTSPGSLASRRTAMSLPFDPPAELPKRSSSFQTPSRSRRGSSASSSRHSDDDGGRPLSAGRPRSAGRPLSSNRPRSGNRPRSASRPLSAGFQTPTKSSMHRTGALRRRPMSAGPLGPLGHRPSPGEGPRSPANEQWVGGLRSDRPTTAPQRRRRGSSRPSSAAASPMQAAAQYEAEEARHALAALAVDINMDEAVRAAELSSDAQSYLASPSPARLTAADKAAQAAVAAIVAAEVAAEAAAFEQAAQELAEHLANENFIGAMLEELVEEVVDTAEEARLARAALEIAKQMMDRQVEKLIRAAALDAIRAKEEAENNEWMKVLRHDSATKIEATYRGHMARKRVAKIDGEQQWEEREQERVGEFQEALDLLAFHKSDFVVNELEAIEAEGRQIRAAATSGDRSGNAVGESRAGAVLLDAPRPRMAAAMVRMTLSSAYKIRKEKEARKLQAMSIEDASKPPAKKPEFEPPVVQMLEFEAHRQAGEARWEQGDAMQKGRIPPAVLEQMQTRSSQTLSIHQGDLPRGTGKQQGQKQSLLCGDASVIAAFVER